MELKKVKLDIFGIISILWVHGLLIAVMLLAMVYFLIGVAFLNLSFLLNLLQHVYEMLKMIFKESNFYERWLKKG